MVRALRALLGASVPSPTGGPTTVAAGAGGRLFCRDRFRAG